MEHLDHEAVRYLCGRQSGAVTLLALVVLAVVAAVLVLPLGLV